MPEIPSKKQKYVTYEKPLNYLLTPGIKVKPIYHLKTWFWTLYGNVPIWLPKQQQNKQYNILRKF